MSFIAGRSVCGMRQSLLRPRNIPVNGCKEGHPGTPSTWLQHFPFVSSQLHLGPGPGAGLGPGLGTGSPLEVAAENKYFT